MTVCDLARSLLSLLLLLPTLISNLTEDMPLISSSSHPPLQLWMMVGMTSNMMNRKMKAGIDPTRDIGVLLMCDMAESLAWVVGDMCEQQMNNCCCKKRNVCSDVFVIVHWLVACDFRLSMVKERIKGLCCDVTAWQFVCLWVTQTRAFPLLVMLTICLHDD